LSERFGFACIATKLQDGGGQSLSRRLTTAPEIATLTIQTLPKTFAGVEGRPNAKLIAEASGDASHGWWWRHIAFTTR
jgi:hypothetical protein